MKPLLLVVSPYYQNISEMLVTGATSVIYQEGYTAEMITVPGALEIPAAIAMAIKSDHYSAYVALGCVIRGETSHYDTVANESAHALQLIAIGHHHAAIGNGILTCESIDQARTRADIDQGNKGGDAAKAALRMLEIRRIFGLEHA
jgi:6,7-dimethyl-8-ribityllumazine synthase